ncbi:MAG: transposase [Sphingobacteriaceae bacterium]
MFTPGKPQKSETPYQRQKKRKKFRRRAAIEPAVGDLKQKFRIAQNYLHGTTSPQINAMLAAAGWNMKKINDKSQERFSFALFLFKI